MLKVIHSNFELDLESLGDISITEENNWFSDRYFTKFTLPFTFYITDEINEALGDILSHFALGIETLLEVSFANNGLVHEALLEIEDLEGRTATASVRFGFEELPNYNKKLSELPLEDFDIQGPDNIYTHAESVIDKTWPEVTHNFVQVFTDKFSSDNEQWAAFEGVINKRVGGAFVENEYDAINDLQLNRNIMSPQPYLMHVLEKGFEDAGFQMAGDFIEDPQFKHKVLSEISDYYSTINVNSEILEMHSGEYSAVNNDNVGTYSKSVTLNTKGRYKIAGNVVVRAKAYGLYAVSFVAIKFRGNVVWSRQIVAQFNGYKEKFYSVNINVEFSETASEDIEFVSEQFIFQRISGDYIEDASICNLSITQLAEFDNNGDFVATLITPNEVKLQKCVPNMAFGELLTVLKNWKNLDIFPLGDTVYMNFIEKQLEAENPVNLQDFEIKDPLRSFSKGRSFLLKFQEVSSEDYTYDELFISLEDAVSSGFVIEKDTSEIIINALPLPITNKNGIVTADHFLDDNSRLKTIVYNGEIAVENVAQDPLNTLILGIYESNYKAWLDFRINAAAYEWQFTMTEEELSTLLIRSKVYAYNNTHIIRTLNKDLVAPGIWYVEISTEALKHIV